MAEAGAGYVVGPADDPDRYRLRRQAGGGDGAELWEADVAVDGGRERVAIRILRPEPGGDASWPAQVELLRQVQHPGVARVRAGFEGATMHPPGEAGEELARYVVTDWVDGEDLRSWVPRHQRAADLAAALRLLGQVATALDLLHVGEATRRGDPVVHGDLGPASVMVDREGRVVLVDFGLPGAAGGGTSGYVAPEVAEGGAGGPAADRYAFGGLAYYVLTGSHPPPDPEELRAGLAGLPGQPDQTAPAELTAMGATDPADRPAATGWVRLLREHLSTTTAPAAEPGGSGWLRSRWFAAVASAGLAALVVLGIGVGTDLFSSPAESAGSAGTAASPTGTSAPSPPAPAAPSPTPAATASPSPAASTPDDPASSPWPGEPDGTVHIVGNVELEVCDTACTRFFDLDQNQGSIIEGRPETDVSATPDGLGLQNQAQVAAWDGSEPPTLEDCRSVPALEWTVPLIAVESFDEQSTFCIRTDQDRYGYLQTQQGGAPEYRFYYVLWMRPGDA